MIYKQIQNILLILMIIYSAQVFSETVSVDLPTQTEAPKKTTSQTTSTVTPKVTNKASSSVSSSTISSSADRSATTASTGKNTPSSTAISKKGTTVAVQTNKNTPPEKNSVTEQKNNTPSLDSTIITNIQTNITTNNMVSGSNITVESKNGLVTLIGNVNSENEADKLIEIAESVTNVKDVDISKLTIKNNKIFEQNQDLVITAKIMGIFIREKLINDKNIIIPIQVKTNNGIVILTGKVASQAEADKAIQLVKSVNGVHKVDSQIIVMEENNKK